MPQVGRYMGRDHTSVLHAIRCHIDTTGAPKPERMASWDKNVIVSGTPQLQLSNGATASYYSGSTSKVLKFRYTVVDGEDTDEEVFMVDVERDCPRK